MSVRQELTALVTAAVLGEDLDAVREHAASVADLICNGDSPVDLHVPAKYVREFCLALHALGQGH